MNLIWNKNVQAFSQRFPSLADIYEAFIKTETAEFYPAMQVENAKNGEPTATLKGIRLHSAYNPSREAFQIIEKTYTKDFNGAFFYGLGLGWQPVIFAKNHPDDPIFIVEPEPSVFFKSMEYLDWTDVLKTEKLIIALSCPPDQVIALAETFGLSKMAFFYNQAFCATNEAYFSTVKTLVSRNLNKDQINQNTKKKFGKLWDRNARMNYQVIKNLDGVEIYRDFFKNSEKDFLLIAAGPSLERLLSKLPALSKKMITVCVDTALRAVLKAGIQPDFIILTDPQFWAYMHIAGQKSPESVLIADAVSYPAVLRFQCKKIVISYSPLPLSEDCADYTALFSKKGELGSGGSVATVAWSFCRFAGAKRIYTAGLDLSFPRNQTHIKGSSFEETVHRVSSRLDQADKATGKLLFSADISKGQSFNGNVVLTDSKMKMFAWWFESQISAHPEVKTFSFCPESLAIPGIETADSDEYLKNH